MQNLYDFDAQEVTEKLFEFVQDMDAADYRETIQEEKEQVTRILYNLQAWSKNELNDPGYKTFLNLLEAVTERL